MSCGRISYCLCGFAGMGVWGCCVLCSCFFLLALAAVAVGVAVAAAAICLF